MNPVQLMAQVKKMQAEMAKAQEELANTVVTGSAAGGAVSVEATCDQHVKSIRIAKDVVDPNDVETLEDLVVVAINDALSKTTEASQKRLSSVTGGMNIPGLT
jgi:DNA-binding YbaB/EbfC family protein